ncbi:MAG TPA: ParB N-terminal domain-containing protein [bacterium]|nr:ParB N-terminal domain-containing protein [bacterium]HPL55993.1 ParB N-terminal domain-containing protein [bacterium]
MKVIEVDLRDLRVGWFVRTGLNEDHVLHLAELIEAGTELPPINITSDMLVVDGRHRIEAYKLNGLDKTKAVLVEVRDKTSLIAEAYRANIGGSLPPTPADTEHTIKLLVGSGASMKKIATLLGLPPSITRRYVGSVKAKDARRRLSEAVSAVVSQNATVEEAARLFGVNPATLQERLGGKQHGDKGRLGISELNQALTRHNKSAGQKLRSIVESAIRLYEDGDATSKEVLDLIKRVDAGLRSSLETNADKNTRFRSAYTTDSD